MESSPLFVECRLLKQLVYKLKNQLGRTPGYKKLMQVYKSLKKHLDGESVPEFPEIVEKAAVPVLDSLQRRLLLPTNFLIVSIYARIHWNLHFVTKKQKRTLVKTKKLRKHVKMSKKTTFSQNDIDEIQQFLASLKK
mmetsp:Transcript_16125/g.23328  ORF Transcript_16125/g.23328 Transcript_16125/m.23328 type:complete len:137 (+) Transcript_16125:16-426(+)